MLIGKEGLTRFRGWYRDSGSSQRLYQTPLKTLLTLFRSVWIRWSRDAPASGLDQLTQKYSNPAVLLSF